MASAQAAPPAPPTIAVGDWQLSPSFELRERSEYRRDPPDLGGFDLYGRLGPRVPNAWVVSERARVGLGVERSALRGQITLQDVRAFGSRTLGSPLADRGAGVFAPYEAFIEVHSSGTRPNSLRAGRQAVVWGEGRLVGTADFSPSGRSLDAVRARLGRGDVEVEALAAILEMPGPLGSSFGDRVGPGRSGVQLYGVMAGWTVAPLLRLEAFALARISRSDGQSLDGSRFAVARLAGETYTGALRLSGDAKGWEYGVEGAYQLGTADALALGGATIQAYAASGHVAKTLPEVLLTPTLRFSLAYASGDDGSATYHQFDPLLADPQRFHGQMDLFAWSNAFDVAGRVQVVPWTDTTVAFEYRYARLAEASGEWIGSYLTAVGRASPPPGHAAAGYAPIAGPPDAELGHELDVAVGWKPWAPFEIRGGWSGLLLGDGARGIMAAFARGRANDDNTVRAANLAQYAYLQATLTMP